MSERQIRLNPLNPLAVLLLALGEIQQVPDLDGVLNGTFSIAAPPV